MQTTIIKCSDNVFPIIVWYFTKKCWKTSKVSAYLGKISKVDFSKWSKVNWCKFYHNFDQQSSLKSFINIRPVNLGKSGNKLQHLLFFENIGRQIYLNFLFLFLFYFIYYQVEHHKLVGVNAEVLQDGHNLRYKYFPVFSDFWYKPTVWPQKIGKLEPGHDENRRQTDRQAGRFLYYQPLFF